MYKEIISDRQGISIMIVFIIGTNSIMISGLSAEKDIWLAIIIAIIMTLPLMCIFARLQSLFLNKDLFNIIEMCLGRFLGKGIVIVITLYVFFEMSLVVKILLNFPLLYL